MIEEYDSPIWDKMIQNSTDICPTPHLGLSISIRDNDYDRFIKTFSHEVRRTGKVDVDTIDVLCEGQCPKGCEKRFKLRLHKSITKKSFDKMAKHAEQYPNHCINIRFQGNITNGNIL